MDIVFLINTFPIYFSLKVAGTATLVGLLLGVGISYILFHYKNKTTRLLGVLLNLPIILPPTVLGYYLLVLLGRTSYVGRLYEQLFGKTIVFTETGAIIAATVVSIPYMIKSISTAFQGIDPEYFEIGRMLGASPFYLFRHVLIPLSYRGILAGISLTFARALGDFGTTLMVAGNIPNKTTTMSMAIYQSIQVGDSETTLLLVGIMTLIAFVVLIFVNVLEESIEKKA